MADIQNQPFSLFLTSKRNGCDAHMRSGKARVLNGNWCVSLKEICFDNTKKLYIPENEDLEFLVCAREQHKQVYEDVFKYIIQQGHGSLEQINTKATFIDFPYSSLMKLKNTDGSNIHLKSGFYSLDELIGKINNLLDVPHITNNRIHVIRENEKIIISWNYFLNHKWEVILFPVMTPSTREVLGLPQLGTTSMADIINAMTNNQDTVLHHHNYVYDSSDIAVTTNIVETNTTFPANTESDGLMGHTIRIVQSSVESSSKIAFSYNDLIFIPCQPKVFDFLAVKLVYTDGFKPAHVRGQFTACLEFTPILDLNVPTGSGTGIKRKKILEAPPEQSGFTRVTTLKLSAVTDSNVEPVKATSREKVDEEQTVPESTKVE